MSHTTIEQSSASDEPDVDARVRLHRVSWADFERICAIKGDSSTPRLTYLDGELELMSPSSDHERIKTTIGRLVEAYADELGLALEGFGSWTLKERRNQAGAEPDECYVLDGPKALPDLAIEVNWSSGGVDKLEVHRRLGVGEVWFWEAGAITVHIRRGGAYELSPRSRLLPQLDLALLASLSNASPQRDAVRQLREALRS